MPSYETITSARARHLRITIHPDGRIVVTRPPHVTDRAVEAFLEKRKDWIEETLARMKKRAGRYGPMLALPKPRLHSAAYNQARKDARVLATERLAHFNATYGFTYGTISIRNQKTRWGSCSAAGNLSFNYRIAFLPSELADYVIVHELCHTKEHNHSEKFWAQVARTIPEPKKRRDELHRFQQ